MKNKRLRFQIIAKQENVIEPGKNIFEKIKGNWHDLYFQNKNPIVVELACGRGEYSIALADRFPNKNFIGVDIKGDRLWKGSILAMEKKMSNVAFLRTNILHLDSFFEKNEITEIWLTFPDPRPKKRDIKRRLTSPRFLDIYKKLIYPQGYIRLKTDNTELYQYTLDELAKRDDVDDLQSTSDVYQSTLRSACFDIKTRYEEIFSNQGEKIKYLQFRLKSA